MTEDLVGDDDSDKADKGCHDENAQAWPNPLHVGVANDDGPRGRADEVLHDHVRQASGQQHEEEDQGEQQDQQHRQLRRFAVAVEEVGLRPVSKRIQVSAPCSLRQAAAGSCIKRKS
jgi:ABC-type nickel/cobalt efflux system permease component RcnA